MDGGEGAGKKGGREGGREDERGEDGRKGRMEEDSKDGAGRKGGGKKAYREWDPSSPLVGWSSSVRLFVSGRGRPCIIARLSPWMEYWWWCARSLLSWCRHAFPSMEWWWGRHFGLLSLIVSLVVVGGRGLRRCRRSSLCVGMGVGRGHRLSCARSFSCVCYSKATWPLLVV